MSNGGVGHSRDVLSCDAFGNVDTGSPGAAGRDIRMAWSSKPLGHILSKR